MSRRDSVGVGAVAFFIIISFLGCGGGGGSNNGGTTAVEPTASINGSVTGTTVTAVDGNQTLDSYKTPINGNPDLDTDSDGQFDSYSFTLKSIKLNKPVRFFLETKGRLFPLYFDSDGDGLPDTNVFSILKEKIVDFGPIRTDPISGKAFLKNPLNDPDVELGSENNTIPNSLLDPDTSNLQLPDLISNGLAALNEGSIVKARKYFEEAESRTAGSTSNDADTARFFYALTRVLALAFEVYSDGNPGNGLNTLGDVLDAFGIPSDDFYRSNYQAISLPVSIPGDSPTGAQLQAFAVEYATSEIQAAISNLDGVSQSFNKAWNEPFTNTVVESDYGDVLFFRALLKAALASLSIQKAYNLDADVAAVVNTLLDADEFNDETIQGFLAANSQFLTLSSSYSSDLAAGKPHVSAALDDFDAAIAWMNSETDDQFDDFINLADQTADQIAQYRADIGDLKNSLNSTTVVRDNMAGVPGYQLTLAPFFSGLDVKTLNLLPVFSGNNVSSLFPEPTFNGIFGTGINLNQDFDPFDGIPDVVQGSSEILFY